MTTYEDDPYDELNMDENDLEETLASLGHARRTIASLENECHALREELNETRRDRDDLQATVEELRHIQRLLPATQETP